MNIGLTNTKISKIGLKAKMNDKVEIEISDGHIMTDGTPYTAVDYNGRRYGGGSPCRDNKEVNSAIQYAKDTIIKEGDKFVIKDMRKKALLTNWI